MKTARLISATAAVAAGVALLSSGVGSLAGWYDAVELPGTTITSGQLKVEQKGTSVRVENNTVIVEASSQLHIAGDALAADLSLRLEGFAAQNGPSVQVVSDRAGRLDASARSWLVDKRDGEMTVTARISLPLASAQALTTQPRVTWSLAQSAPGQGWSSETVHQVSFAGLWPGAPAFPKLGCAPGSAAGSITISWMWEGAEPARWEIVQRNSAGNNFTVLDVAVVKTTMPDGRIVYSTTIDTQNSNWLYSVRAIRADGTPWESERINRTCAVVNQSGN
jgi:alternate signal-mediated exported protein